MTAKRVLTVAVGDPPALGAWLAARLGVGQAEAAALVARGGVHVAGRRATDATRAMRPGEKVVVYPAAQAAAADFAVAYEDPWLIVADKPAGLPSQPTRADADALDARVRRRWPEARMLHRLDRDASGLVLFARAPEARAALQAALEHGRIERRYVAVAAGRLEGEGRIALRIARDPADARRRVALPEQAPGGQPAASRYRAVAHGARSTAVALTLETGRTHQLRVHLQAIGHPILGDRLYGGPEAPRLCLHATELALPHPRDGRPIVVSSPVPGDLPFGAPP